MSDSLKPHPSKVTAVATAKSAHDAAAKKHVNLIETKEALRVEREGLMARAASTVGEAAETVASGPPGPIAKVLANFLGGKNPLLGTRDAAVLDAVAVKIDERIVAANSVVVEKRVELQAAEQARDLDELCRVHCYLSREFEQHAALLERMGALDAGFNAAGIDRSTLMLSQDAVKILLAALEGARWATLNGREAKTLAAFAALQVSHG